MDQASFVVVGSIVLDCIHPLKVIKYFTNKGMKVIKDLYKNKKLMVFELQEFIRLIIKKDYETRDFWLAHSLMNLIVIESIIKSKNNPGTDVNCFCLG